jgi:hypothetical protein
MGQLVPGVRIPVLPPIRGLGSLVDRQPSKLYQGGSIPPARTNLCDVRLWEGHPVLQIGEEGSNPSRCANLLPLGRAARRRTLNPFSPVQLWEGLPIPGVAKRPRQWSHKPPSGVQLTPSGPIMLAMLDGNERPACEAGGQGFKSLSQYQFTGVVQRQNIGLQNQGSGFKSLHPCQLLDVSFFPQLDIKKPLCRAGKRG